MKFFSLVFSLLLLTISSQAHAWWNTPYAYSPHRTSYWPSVWPAYVQPQYNAAPNAGWNVRGSMNQRGDTRFVIEFQGNIYDMQSGNGYGYPAYSRFRGNPYSMQGRRW